MRSDSGPEVSRFTIPLLITVCVSLLAPPGGRADVVRLRNGVELSGQVLEAESSEHVRLRSGHGAIVVLARDDVHFLTRRSVTQETYDQRVRRMADTAANHRIMAVWCKQNRLRAESLRHLKRLTELDPTDVSAQRSLGRKWDGQRWRSMERVMADRGYVRFDGRYVSRQEHDLLTKDDAFRDAENQWQRLLQQLADQLDRATPNDREAALAELVAVRDVHAISPMTQLFSDHRDPRVRIAYVQALGEMDHPRILAPLLNQSLRDVDAVVSRAATLAIPPLQRPSAFGELQDLLTDESNTVVNRAARLLGEWEDDEAVEDLVEALVTSHAYEARISTAQEVLDAAAALPAANLTPREVRLSLRAGRVPTGAIPLQSADVATDRGLVQVIYRHRNAPVLTALQTLTGEDFQFDQRSWRLWLAREE